MVGYSGPRTQVRFRESVASDVFALIVAFAACAACALIAFNIMFGGAGVVAIVFLALTALGALFMGMVSLGRIIAAARGRSDVLVIKDGGLEVAGNWIAFGDILCASSIRQAVVTPSSSTGSSSFASRQMLALKLTAEAVGKVEAKGERVSKADGGILIEFNGLVPSIERAIAELESGGVNVADDCGMEPGGGISEAVFDLVRRGLDKEARKVLRRAFGLGRRDARMMVERLAQKLRGQG